MGRLEGVIFDVDGTLVDSERDGHRVAFNLAFEEAGLPDRWDVETYGRLLQVTGGGRRLAAWFEENGMPADEAQEQGRRLHVRKTEIMRELVTDGRIEARPGIRALIDSLAAAGVPMHVATTGTRAWVEPLLETVFGNPFDLVVTGSEVTDLKPDPAVYLEVLRRTGRPAEAVVAVEDSANGVQAAVAAGLRCVATSNIYTVDDDLSGAELVVGSADHPALTAWFRERLPHGGGSDTGSGAVLAE